MRHPLISTMGVQHTIDNSYYHRSCGTHLKIINSIVRCQWEIEHVKTGIEGECEAVYVYYGQK